MRSLLVSLVFLTAPFLALSQDTVGVSTSINLESIPEEEYGFFYKPKLVLGLGGHNSLVGGEKVRIGGLRLGLEFRKKWRFGISFNQLSPPIQRIGGTEQNTIFYRVEFGYAGLFGEYILLNNRRWEFSTGLLLGVGSTDIAQRFDVKEDFIPTTSSDLTVVQISGVGYYKVWKWLGIGASLGYRNVSSDNQKDQQLAKIVDRAFDGPNWAIKTKIYVGELWRALFKKKDKKKRKKNVEPKTMDRGTLESQ
ncbi:MAG: hypothetical protein JKY52_05915 [Flavobacteriales bacterium]|nr:hypothetical protein [Flavobacteriales bacterium]